MKPRALGVPRCSATEVSFHEFASGFRQLRDPPVSDEPFLKRIEANAKRA